MDVCTPRYGAMLTLIVKPEKSNEREDKNILLIGLNSSPKRTVKVKERQNTNEAVIWREVLNSSVH